MQGSFSILSMLYRSCSIKTDFPVPRSPARIVRLFRGIPFGRTLSTASIPVSNDFGSKGTTIESQRTRCRDKGHCNLLARVSPLETREVSAVGGWNCSEYSDLQSTEKR